MRIAIVGGTGTLGGHVATELRSRGHDVRVLSRSAPGYRVDLVTGTGLGPALRGCDAVVDASHNASRRAAAVLVGGTRRLLGAEQAAGVRHHVCVSIVGCDQLPMGYYAVSRLALDALGSARARREGYVGPGLPEPLVEDLGPGPADRVTLDESASMALLVVLERLSPAERTSFLLHDVFGMPFAEVAGVIGRSPAAVRQLASRARQHVEEGRPRFPPTRAQITALDAIRNPDKLTALRELGG